MSTPGKQASDRAYYEANRDRIRARSKAYRVANPEKAAASVRAWHIAHAERVREIKREWAAANPEARTRWAVIHPAVVRDIKARYKSKRRALEKGAPFTTITAADRHSILSENGGRCVYCKERAATTLDHVIPLTRGGVHAVFNLVGACVSCNSRKNARLLAEWER